MALAGVLTSAVSSFSLMVPFVHCLITGILKLPAGALGSFGAALLEPVRVSALTFATDQHRPVYRQPFGQWIHASSTCSAR